MTTGWVDRTGTPWPRASSSLTLRARISRRSPRGCFAADASPRCPAAHPTFSRMAHSGPVPEVDPGQGRDAVGVVMHPAQEGVAVRAVGEVPGRRVDGVEDHLPRGALAQLGDMNRRRTAWP